MARSLLSCHDITHGFSTKPLFRDLTLTLSEGDRVGLVGFNGSGKSTFLHILAGLIPPASGVVTVRRGLRIAMVEQFLPPHLTQQSMHGSIIDALDPGEADQTYRADLTLEEMGFLSDQFHQPIGQLSGGELNRLMLARALAKSPDLLLLDEPTNHLDMETQIFFERFFRERLACAFLVVSHDRAFLDATTNRTLFLRDGTIYSFMQPYSAARENLAKADVAAALARKAEEKELERLRRSAKRLAEWGRNFDNEKFARRAKTMQKRVAKLEEHVSFVSKDRAADLYLETEHARGNRLIHISSLHVKAGERTLFHAEDLVVRPGERLALFGPNGCGKSTFLTQVMHAAADPDRFPQIRFSPQCRIAYYDQALSGLDPGETLFSIVHRRSAIGDHAVRHELIGAGFPFERHHDALSSLSGGERARLMFLMIRLERPSLLILDEPTNHIDIDGKEQLEQEILDSGASVLCVSHDRRFIESIATRAILVRNGKLTEIDGPEDYYAMIDDPLPIPSAHKTSRPRSAQVQTQIQTQTQTSAQDDPDAILTELLDLEAKLAADLQRKPAHQKTAKQQEWRLRIDMLNRKLAGES